MRASIAVSLVLPAIVLALLSCSKASPDDAEADSGLTYVDLIGTWSVAGVDVARGPTAVCGTLQVGPEETDEMHLILQSNEEFSEVRPQLMEVIAHLNQAHIRQPGPGIEQSGPNRAYLIQLTAGLQSGTIVETWNNESLPPGLYGTIIKNDRAGGVFPPCPTN